MIWQRIQAWFPSPPGATPAEAAAFWRIRWAICIFVVGIFASGREQSSWPIIMWTIYSQKHYPFPDTTTSAVELRAVTQRGQSIVLRPHELYPMPYCQHVAPRLIARAFAGKECAARGRRSALSRPSRRQPIAARRDRCDRRLAARVASHSARRAARRSRKSNSGSALRQVRNTQQPDRRGPRMMWRLAQACERGVTAWLTAPEPNAAGRMGLFRIFYAAFYLWHLSWRIGSDLAGLPVPENRRVFIVNWLPKHEMSPLLFQGLESLLAAALVILLAGYRVRLATAVVLVLGCLNEALFSSTGRESSPIFLAFYIPLLMLLAGRWGEAYSLDALLRARAGRPTTSPADTGWSHFLSARATLVILSAMFFSAMLLKIAFGGVWLAHPDLLANAMLHKNIEAAIIELPLNPLAPLIARQPALYVALQLSVLLFEGLFFLVLVDRDLRRLWLGLALVFHTINANWLIVTFTPILVVYGLFIDWQGVRQRLWPWPIRIADRLPTKLLIAATLLRVWPSACFGTMATACATSCAWAASSTGGPSGGRLECWGCIGSSGRRFVWQLACCDNRAPQSQITRQHAHIHLEVVGQLANQLPTERPFPSQDFGNGGLGNPCFLAQLCRADALGFQ